MSSQTIHPKSYTRHTYKITSLHKRPTELICLKNGNCVLSRQNRCVIISMLSDEKHLQHTLTFDDFVTKIFPYHDGFLVFSDRVFYVDNNNNIAVFGQISSFKDIYLRYFSQQQQLYGYWAEGNSQGIVNIGRKQLAYKGDRRLKQGQCLSSADQSQTIITQIQNGSVVLFNLGLQKSKQWPLPFEDRVQSFYLTGKKSALCTRGSKSQLFTIWNVEFGKQGTFQKHKIIPPQTIIMFNSINILQNLLLFSNQQQAFVYNYRSERILTSFRTSAIQISRQMSPNFNNFYEYEYTSKNGLVLVRHKAESSRRSLAMHLVKKSGLQELYGGDGLIQFILKVLELD